MSNRATRLLTVCLLAAPCIALCGCDAHLDESLLNTQANYSINISLPYATVTPPPAHKEEAQALVIDAEGSVTVNDSASILRDNEAGNSADLSNYKSLRQGNTGLAVQALQTRLQELGYFTQGVSGIFDEETEGAVRRFEQTYGTMQTGVATADLQERLFSANAVAYASEAYNEAVVSQYTILERGDVGSSVYALQQRLKNLGYPISSLTGIYDNETANAVMLFYEAYGLTASDVANVALQKEIYSDSAKPYGDGGSSAVSASDSLNVMAEDSVKQVQKRLIDLGYLSGEATGQLDTNTQIAVKLFEAACGQLPSGALSSDIESMLALDTAPTFDSITASYTNLLEGSGGEAVERLQARLVELGYAKGSPNGEYGSATTASVKLFQQINGLEETGVANTYVQAVLYSSFALNIDGETAISTVPTPTEAPKEEVQQPSASDRLAPGSTGEAVLRLQNRLTELGFISSITGNYDGLTSRAVSAFQACLGCEPSGVAGSGLLSFIHSNAAPNSSMVYFAEVQPFRRLSIGDMGDDVTALQKRLWELKYLEKDAIRDSVGTFNEATQQSVMQLQADLAYETLDGIASAELQCYMFSQYSTPFKQ